MSMDFYYKNLKGTFSDDGMIFFYDGLCYLPFPDQETLDFWLGEYDKTDWEHTRAIIKGRAEITKKYLAMIANEWYEITDKDLIILNRKMAQWWK